MSNELLLVLLNFFVWFVPLYYFRGLSRIVYLAVALIFSGSYWSLSAIKLIFGSEYSVSIFEEHVNQSLYYSALAGLSFYVAAVFFGPRFTRIEKGRLSVLLSLKELLPNLRFLGLLKLVVFLITVYCFYEALGLIGISGRRYYIDEIAPFWHFVLLPFNGLFLLLCILYDFRNEKKAKSLFLTFFLSVCHVVLVGFDGSRRDAFLPIAGYGIVFFFIYREGRMNGRENEYIGPLLMALSLVLVSSFLSINRAFDVGWTFVLEGQFWKASSFEAVVKYVFSAMPTLHVNTSMIEYVDNYGEQGYFSYLKGFLNTIFPRFIFGEYLFGQPLVLELQERMGWVGFDFGFMAEAIYSGGGSGVVLVHFFFGLWMAVLLRGVNKGRVIFLALLIGFIFGMVNSLRSDFMNLLKSSFYSSIFLYAFFWVSVTKFKTHV